MNPAGARAADLISKVSKNFFIVAAQSVSSRNNTTNNITMDNNEIPEDVIAVNDEIFEVDKILATRMQGRTRMFLVRWKNYGPEADSWEPQDMLMEGAEETVKEFMLTKKKERTEKRRNSKSSNKRGRPKSSRSSTRSVGKLDDSDKDVSSEDSDRSDGEYGPKSKRTRSSTANDRKSKGKAQPVNEPKFIPRQINLNKKPWFMDSSSESDSEKSVSQPPESDVPSPSNQNGLIPKIKIKPPVSAPSVEPSSSTKGAQEINNNDNKKKESKKDKKKNKKKLVFEGIFKKSENEGLFFVAKGVGEVESQVLSQEDAIETDSRSLAKYLLEKVVFNPSGSPVVHHIEDPSRYHNY